jgi:non-homologous end joining protein Ku
MAPRPHWKGFLKLSLVSCPIALYPAISAAERVAFRQVNKQTGNRLRQQLVDSVTGEPVQSYDKGRGYEVGQNQFLMVQDEELEAAQQEARARPFSAAPATAAAAVPETDPPARQRPRTIARREEAPQEKEPAPAALPVPVRIENNRTIALDRFLARTEIDPRYYNMPYYIAPRDEVGQEAFAVIRDAMAKKGVVGMGRIVLANRERPIIIEPMGTGLRGITLRYAHEVRSEAEYFADIPNMTLPDEMLRVAEHILDTKMAAFDPAFLEDRYRTVLVSMLREKQAQLPAPASPAAPSPQNVINLMDALRRSVANEKGDSSASPKPRRPVAAKSMRKPPARSRKSA